MISYSLGRLSDRPMSFPIKEKYPVQPNLVFGGVCSGCNHRLSAEPDRWMLFCESESMSETRVPDNATGNSLVSDGITLAQAAKQHKLREVQNLICNSCGRIHENRRVHRRSHYGIVATVGVWCTLPLYASGAFGYALDFLLTVVITLVLLGVYSIVRITRNPWKMPESCSDCDGGPLLPAMTMLQRNFLCPNCGDRTFRYSAAD